MESSRPGAEFFASAYQAGAPWDIGEAQPDLIALIDENPPISPVLDVGCGTGDLTWSLAKRGLSVLGIDLAEAAIGQARAKAGQHSPDTQRLVEFRVADGLHLVQIPEHIHTIVDSGFFHIFGPAERQQFVKQLETKIPVGGRYYLLGFAISPPIPNAPREVSEEELRQFFNADKGWKIVVLRRVQFVITRGKIPAIAACVERTAEPN